MLLTTRILGALFLTYFGARIFRRLLADVAIPATARTILAHVLSFAVLGAIAAFMKAGVNETLLESAALIYIVPQLLWLAIDLGAVGKLLRR